LARLIEPAVLDLAAEGVRAVEFYRRHFLFQRGGLLLDVQIEFQPDSGWISLAGQILDPRQPSSKFGDRLVTLMSDNAELARAVSNQFGEFHMEFRPAENVMLVINLEGDSLLVTPLPYSLWEMTLPSSGSDSTTEDDDARNF
jgi:hypothetical protein